MTSDEQKIAEADKAASDKLQEDAIVGTLGIIASCSALVPPIGTVASVVIYAGIGIYKLSEAIDKAETATAKYLDEMKLEVGAKTAQKNAFALASNRPVVPIDLYSGPPMYWIVDSDPIVGEDSYYKIPDGNVFWPATQEVGGKSIPINLPESDKNDLNVDNVYAATPPKRNSTPSVCVFFWAVPIFFARLSENIGEIVFGIGYNQNDICDFDKTKTKKEYLAAYIKKILKQGRLDSAGNWFGKIGTIIPPLAATDNDYAGRYYGRMAWVHNLAMQNIIDSDGSRMARTGLSYSDDIISKYPNNSYQFWRSWQALNASPRWTAINNQPVAQQSGYIFDLRGLLSRYYINDTAFDKLRTDLALDETNLYYVTTIEDNAAYYNDDKNHYINWGTTVYESTEKFTYYSNREQAKRLELAGKGIDRFGLSVSGYLQAITDAGGYKRVSDHFTSATTKYGSLTGITQGWFGESLSNGYSKSVWHGNFALAPYSLYTVAKTVQKTNGRAPVLTVDTNNSSYIFMDFDPAQINNGDEKYPGLDNISKYGWLRKLAIMPGFPVTTGQSDLQDSQYATEVNWAYNSGYNLDDSDKERSFRNYTFNPSPVLRSDVAIPSGGGLPSLPKNTMWQSLMPEIYEIIKIRPPLQNRTEATVLLTEPYWGEAQWAYDLAKSNPSLKTQGIGFAVIKPAKVNNLFALAIFKFSRNRFHTLAAGPEYPVTSAYYRTNYAENKPIVEIHGSQYPTPSPFYCGRRADARTQPAWKALRDITNKTNKSLSGANDSGWEDCHEWSWPYPTGILNTIGDVSAELYNSGLGEGIGRSGLSPSCIATGPTLWGDLFLFSKVYKAWHGGEGSGWSSNPENKDEFRKALGSAFWSTITEMQVGAYSRYASHSPTYGITLSDKARAKFGAFSGNDSARKLFLDACSANPNNPTIINGKKLTPDEAADLCMNIVNTWFNGTFPRPTSKLTNSLSNNDWNKEMLSNVCTAHIMLKNWAIDLGKPADQKIGAKFPSEWYSINFFGLNKAQQSAIDAFNESQNAKLASKNPLAQLNSIINSEHTKTTAELAADGTVVKKSKAPIVIAASIMSLLAIGLTVAVVKRHNKQAA